MALVPLAEHIFVFFTTAAVIAALPDRHRVAGGVHRRRQRSQPAGCLLAEGALSEITARDQDVAALGEGLANFCQLVRVFAVHGIESQARGPQLQLGLAAVRGQVSTRLCFKTRWIAHTSPTR